MNTLAVETAWKDAAADVYAPLPGFCAASDTIVDGEATIVVFLCEELAHKAGPYWLAQMRIEIDAPALAEASALTGYSAVWNDLLAWLEQDPIWVAAHPLIDPPSVGFAGSGVQLNGYYVQTSGQGARDDRWVASIALVGGVQRV